MATPLASTRSSRERQKPPLPYSGLLRRVSSRVDQLHDELALESETNVEFEQAAKASLELLEGEVSALRKALDALRDAFLKELDLLGASLRGEISRLDGRQDASLKELDHLGASLRGELSRLDGRQADSERSARQAASAPRLTSVAEERERREFQGQLERQREMLQQLEQRADALARHLDEAQERQQRAERHTHGQLELVEGRVDELQEAQQLAHERAELLARDVHAVLETLPSIEESFLQSHRHLQEKLGAASQEVSWLGDAAAAERGRAASREERWESRLRAAEAALHEELGKRHLQLQASVARQLEGMSRVLAEGGWLAGPPGPGAPPPLGTDPPDRRHASCKFGGLDPMPPIPRAAAPHGPWFD